MSSGVLDACLPSLRNAPSSFRNRLLEPSHTLDFRPRSGQMLSFKNLKLGFPEVMTLVNLYTGCSRTIGEYLLLGDREAEKAGLVREK